MEVVEKNEDPDDYFYKGFTIYNWKTGYIPTEEYEWHVGGQDYEAHEIASAIFENHINHIYSKPNMRIIRIRSKAN